MRNIKLETQLLKEFKRLKEEAEDIIRNECQELISNKCDEISQLKLKAMEDKGKELINITNKLVPFATEADEDFKEFKKVRSEFSKLLDETKKYYSIYGQLTLEIFDEVKDYIRYNTKRMEKIIHEAKNWYKLQQAANIMQLQTKNSYKNMVITIENGIDETVNTYLELMEDERVSTYDIVQDRLMYLSKLEEEELSKKDGSHRKLEKMVDYKKIRTFLKENKFEFESQKATSHQRFKKDGKGRGTVLPKHGKSINKGLGYTIQKQVFGSLI